MKTLILLPTPRASDVKSEPLSQHPKYDKVETRLRRLKLLPTPTSSDASNSRKATHPGYTDKSHAGTTLLDAALLSSGLSTSPRSSGGKASSAGLRLNPSFVEWMMGSPDGWSDPDCPLSATEFSSKQAGSSDDGS